MKIKDFINDKGRVSSTKTTEKWVLKNFPEEFEKIKKNSTFIGLSNCSFSEEIYHYLKKEKSRIKCKNCGEKTPKFSGLSTGYLDYCSSKCSNSSKDVRLKKENAYLEKYGVVNPSKSNVVVAKIQKTFEERYGGNPFVIEEFKKKIKETNLLKYGTESPLSKGSSIRKRINEKIIQNFLEKYKHLEIIEVDENKGGFAKIRCKKCLGVFEISKWNLYQRTKFEFVTNLCTICNPIGFSNNSEIENFVRTVLEEMGLEFEEGNRKILEGKEIDFFIPSKNIGIEVNGIFWHSEIFKEPGYHIDKTNLAERKGIRLIQIFEDEIREVPHIVKNRIHSILGVAEKKVFARKCEVRCVSKKESLEFLTNNHIQGSIGCSVSIGLFFDDCLVSLMTFGALRKNLGSKKKEGVWELLRFCNLGGFSVVGGASKLLNYFIEKYSPKKVVSYCDRRWSNGDIYKKIGFKLDSATKPNYYYVKNNRRENRFKYRKDVLVKEGFDPSKSEASIMCERGFYRIYDCGSFRFSLDI